MKKIKRQARSVPDSISRVERLSASLPVTEVSVPVTIRKQKLNAYKGKYNYFLRRYYVGCVPVALMYIYPDDSEMGSLNPIDGENGERASICVHISSTKFAQTGEGGAWFLKKSNAQQFILDELTRQP